MGRNDPMTLDTDEPKEALRQIANYLRCMMMTRCRAVVREGEIVGYYQTEEYLKGLLEIADECDRIIKPTGNRVYIREVIADYLSKTGWAISTELKYFEVWHNDKYPTGEILLPVHGQALKDFDQRMNDAFNYILEFEKSNFISFGEA